MMLDDRGWSVYRLSKETGLPYSSINNIFSRNTEPSLHIIKKICTALGLSLSDFFADEPVPVGELQGQDERALISKYRSLTKNERKLLSAYLSGLLKEDMYS